MKDYYTSQLERLEPDKEFYSIKITDGNGNATNYINITPAQLEKIRDILTNQEKTR